MLCAYTARWWTRSVTSTRSARGRARRPRTDVCGVSFNGAQLPVLLTLAAVDKVLESCFQLLSLFFMTIGRTSDAPAAYALTSTIKRLLDHLTESQLFSIKDLESISQTLDRLDTIVQNAESKHSPYLVELLANRVELCKESLAGLQKQLNELEEPLPAIHEKLISIIRSTSFANTKAKVRDTMDVTQHVADVDYSFRRRRWKSSKLRPKTSTRRGWTESSSTRTARWPLATTGSARC